jgi:hypothetical protein
MWRNTKELELKFVFPLSDEPLFGYYLREVKTIRES